MPKRILHNSHRRREYVLEIKDLGKLTYFLGLEVTYTPDGLFPCQGKYAQDILSRFDMFDCKPISTPLAAGDSGPLFLDITRYRSLLGALQLII